MNTYVGNDRSFRWLQRIVRIYGALTVGHVIVRFWLWDPFGTIAMLIITVGLVVVGVWIVWLITR